MKIHYMTADRLNLNKILFDRLPPGTRSDLIINRYGVEIVKGHGFIAIRTPGQPSYYFGNLFFLNDPGSHPLEFWLDQFQRTFLDIDGIKHCTLVWNCPIPKGEFLQRLNNEKFHLDHLDVRAVTRLQWLAPYMVLPEGLVIRDLVSERDWQQWFVLNLACRDPAHTEADYLPYLEGQRANYQRLLDENQGYHTGVFSNDGQLVAFAGVYFLNNLGRFQFVYTHPDYRRKGLCSLLLTRLANRGFSRAEQLIILADKHDKATHLYAKLGFKLLGVESSACRWT